VFVDQETEVPEGETVVFSAHGVAPSVHANAQTRALRTIDATCPLVTKVHAQARRYAEAGYALVLIGHAGHEEVEGTLGEAPDAIVLVQSTEDAELVSLPDDRPLAYLTQTTLSVDEAGEIVAVLRRRFPRIEGPAREDICYATSNRQWAVKELLREIDLLLVVGSPNSSNSQRLVDVARAEGTPAHLVDDVRGIDERWLDACDTVGLSSGASAPERLVAEVCAWFAARGAEVREQEPVHEDVSFKLPVELRRAERTAA
jgi:4-hydroxy-3-methylbut-2-enyl diphosphate reductase